MPDIYTALDGMTKEGAALQPAGKGVTPEQQKRLDYMSAPQTIIDENTYIHGVPQTVDAAKKYMGAMTNLSELPQKEGMFDAQAISDSVPRLPEYAKPGNYNTPLEPQEEQEFRQWVQQNKIPFDPQAPVSDYDMRGFFKALKSGDPKAATAINPNDKQPHFPDYWKTPYHESFSAESQWADPEKAPRWNSKDQLVMPDGKVVFDERKKQTEKVSGKNDQNKAVLQELKTYMQKNKIPTDVGQLLSGDHPHGVAAVVKAYQKMHGAGGSDAQ